MKNKKRKNNKHSMLRHFPEVQSMIGIPIVTVMTGINWKFYTYCTHGV